MTTPAAPTDAEIRLVEQYVRVLDFVSRCAQAIDTGNWHYLWAKTAQLEDAAGGLARVANQTWEQVSAGRPRPRAEVVRAEVAHQGRHSLAGRLLHPTNPGREATDGITEDPGEFAIAAFQVACGPIMSPGYVCWHPRVLDHQVNYGDDPDPTRLICQVTLASFLPMRLGSPWWSWTTYLGREWSEPEEGRHAALASLRLRWPLPVTPSPAHNRPPGPASRTCVTPRRQCGRWST